MVCVRDHFGESQRNGVWALMRYCLGYKLSYCAPQCSLVCSDVGVFIVIFDVALHCCFVIFVVKTDLVSIWMVHMTEITASHRIRRREELKMPTMTRKWRVLVKKQRLRRHLEFDVGFFSPDEVFGDDNSKIFSSTTVSSSLPSIQYLNPEFLCPMCITSHLITLNNICHSSAYDRSLSKSF